MKQITTILLLIIVVNAKSQYVWTKVCDMEANGTTTEWRYVPVVKKDTIKIVAKAEKPARFDSTWIPKLTFSGNGGTGTTAGTITVNDTASTLAPITINGTSISGTPTWTTNTRTTTRKKVTRTSVSYHWLLVNNNGKVTRWEESIKKAK